MTQASNLLLIVCLHVSVTLQAISGSGTALISFTKIDYTNQSMADLGLPEENYSPSNFYRIGLIGKQRVVGPDDQRIYRSR